MSSTPAGRFQHFQHTPENAKPASCSEGADALKLKSAPAAEHCFSCCSRPRSILCGLPSARLQELDQLRQSNICPAGTTLFQEGDYPAAVYCICAGQVKLFRTSPDGRAVVFGIATAGDVFGVRAVLLGEPHDLAAEASMETRLCHIYRNDFLNFLKHNLDVCFRLAGRLSMELGTAYQQVYRAALKPAAERLAEVLLALCQTHGQPIAHGIVLRTNMGQDDLAELVGMSRRSLNRALGALKGQGLIECRHRSIIVCDPAGLRASLVS